MMLNEEHAERAREIIATVTRADVYTAVENDGCVEISIAHCFRQRDRARISLESNLFVIREIYAIDHVGNDIVMVTDDFEDATILALAYAQNLVWRFPGLCNGEA